MELSLILEILFFIAINVNDLKILNSIILSLIF
ncbi:hypothetical protein BHW_0900076 [Borrelia hermsii MTW]|nr:hypothetical protein BHW_0900076 [Borrelia hermsii MTW]